MPDLVVYRSTHPDVLAHWHGTIEARKAWRGKVNALVAELGFAGHNIALRGQRVVGVIYPGQGIPDGWRRDRKFTEGIVPARKTPQGKQIGKRLDELTEPSPRDRLPGQMPSAAFSSLSLMRPGVALIGDAVYVTWSDELEKADASIVDSGVWERLKLSEYYAVLEAEEAMAS